MPDDSDDAQPDEEVIDEFAEQHGIDGESWTEDGDKYRCPECEAVNEQRAGGCSVCGWQPGAL